MTSTNRASFELQRHEATRDGNSRHRYVFSNTVTSRSYLRRSEVDVVRQLPRVRDVVPHAGGHHRDDGQHEHPTPRPLPHHQHDERRHEKQLRVDAHVVRVCQALRTNVNRTTDRVRKCESNEPCL